MRVIRISAEFELDRHATWLAARQAKNSVKSGLVALGLRTPDDSERGRAEATSANGERTGDRHARVGESSGHSAPTDGDP